MIDHYTQCRMQRYCGKTKQLRVAYIPSKFAIVGDHVKLRIDEKWESGWEILSAGATRVGGEDSNTYAARRHMKSVFGGRI